MKTKYGFPVANAKNFLKTVEVLGIKYWSHVQPAMSLKDYLARDLTGKQQEEVRLFAPQSEVVFLADPKGDPFVGFRSVGKNWASVFTLIDEDLVPVIAEYKHGAHTISIGLPSGVPGRKDKDLVSPMTECAKREFTEETGFRLKQITLLSKPEGIPISGRQSTQRFFPFLGIIETPISRIEPKLDEREDLKVILVPLGEWLKLIEMGEVTEDSTISTTFLALQYLGKLKVI